MAAAMGATSWRCSRGGANGRPSSQRNQWRFGRCRAGLTGGKLISVDPAADELIDAPMSESLLELAWEDHGFRGPLSTVGKARNALSESRLIERTVSVLPMPDAPVMMALLDRLAS